MNFLASLGLFKLTQTNLLCSGSLAHSTLTFVVVWTNFLNQCSRVFRPFSYLFASQSQREFSSLLPKEFQDLYHPLLCSAPSIHLPLRAQTVLPSFACFFYFTEINNTLFWLFHFIIDRSLNLLSLEVSYFFEILKSVSPSQSQSFNRHHLFFSLLDQTQHRLHH